MVRMINGCIFAIGLLLVTTSRGTEVDGGAQLDLRDGRAVLALGSGATVTYLGKTTDVSDFSSTGLNLGQLGYYFPQFGQPNPKTRKKARDNMRFSKPSWQEDWEWKVFELCGGDPCNLFSPDAGVFDVREGEEGIGVYSKSGGSGWAYIKYTGGDGHSGAAIDKAANGGSNNTVNHIRMKTSVPSQLCMSILTDNTNGEHNINNILAARIGWYPNTDWEAGTASVPSSHLTFNNVPDVYTFKFLDMTDKDFIKIRLNANSGTNPGIGGLMFDTCQRFAPRYDYDGDLEADFAVWRDSTSTWYVRKSSTGGTLTDGLGISSDTPVSGDFDGDGKTDFAVWRSANGKWFDKTGTWWGTAHGLSGDTPVPADYDGDGRTDLAVWRPSTSTWYGRNSTGGTWSNGMGLFGDIPVPADYDGDGTDDLAVWRPANGKWFDDSGTHWGTTFGQFGDIPVPADYDGDGKADIAVWRDSISSWYIRFSATGSTWSSEHGLSGDIPVPADYNGDGMSDLAVWRPSSSRLYVSTSSGENWDVRHGVPGDVPQP